MTSFRIDRCQSSADVEAVLGLFRAYAASLSVDLCFQNFEAELAGLPGAYAPLKGALLLARGAAGESLGCVALRPTAEPSVCEMKRLYVAPEGRGTGLGRALAEAIMTEARLLGYAEIRLDTLPEMADAIGLYGRLGFRPIAPYYDTPVAGTHFLAKTLAS
jgi:ribosomal protein S18 acetylase RimI-like enzyme